MIGFFNFKFLRLILPTDYLFYNESRNNSSFLPLFTTTSHGKEMTSNDHSPTLLLPNSMCCHPAHPIISLIINTNVADQKQLISFVKALTGMDDFLRNDFIVPYYNQKRIDSGKEPKDISELGAEDIDGLQKGLLIHYLSLIGEENANAIVDKYNIISDNLSQLFKTKRAHMIDGIANQGAEHRRMTNYEVDFSVAQNFEYAIPAGEEYQDLSELKDHLDKAFKRMALNS